MSLEWCMSHTWNLAFSCSQPLSNSGLQLKDGGDATKESHKQAVRKRRVRKDWGGPPRLLSPFSPSVEEVEGPSLLLLAPSPSGAARISSKPPGSLQSPRLPQSHLLHASAPPITGPQFPKPHPVSLLASPRLSLLSAHWTIRWIPWRFCAFSCFSSSILSLHASVILFLFSKPLLSKCLSTFKAASSASVPVHTVSTVTPLWIYTIIDPPVCLLREWRQQRACVLLSTPVVHTILQHILGAYISEVRLYSRVLCFKEHVRGHSLTEFVEIFRISRTGQQAARTGCLRCSCSVRTFQLTSCLSLGLKVYLFKKMDVLFRF